MAKRAVCIGINDYPGSGNDLSGCVNDARDWADLLTGLFEFAKGNVTVATDRQATRNNVLTLLRNLVGSARANDALVFTYSGHGTSVRSDNDDEADNRDEAICARDANIIDDEIRAILEKLNPAARLTVISDSCHSGTVTRAMMARAARHRVAHDPRPRYLPPRAAADAMRLQLLPVRRRMFYAQSSMREVLLTGCNANEFSYDAVIHDRANGALTRIAIDLLKAKGPNLTYREWHRSIRRRLPNAQYPQSPQLEGSQRNKDRKVFS